MERRTVKTKTLRHEPFLRLCRIIVLLALPILLISGCATTTQVVLAPDPDGKVGALDIATDKGSQTLNQAWQATESDSMSAVPSEPKILNEKEVRYAFRDALAAEPIQPKPVQPEQPMQQKVVQPEQPMQQKVVQPTSFIIYFMSNSSDLSEEAFSELSKALDAIKSRKSTEIIISGHTDTVASSSYNRRLSLKRAKAVADALVEKGIDRQTLKVTYHGKEKLLVPTPDGVPDLRNRRVEITVR
jgi:outer membrane protein OmpA-like peptidoglycan-associated protein